MIDEISMVLENFTIEDDYEYCLSTEFKGLGYKFTSMDSDEDSSCHSDTCSWYILFMLEKDGVTFSVSVNGDAIKEVSYERWVSTYGYTIDDFSVTKL